MIDNSLSEYMFALRKECPGKTWWYADPTHPSVARALRIDPSDDGAVYAMTPFRYCHYDMRHLILVAYPAPFIFDPTPDWLDITHVIAWEPTTDTVTVLDDDEPQLVGNLTDDANSIYASPRAFFQAWAMERAKFQVQRQAYAGKDWHTPPAETDLVPGALLIGPIARVQINPFTMPEHVECVGVNSRELNRAIMRAARLPSAFERAAA